ncbi:uncharacterized protein LOC110975551 isoform X1 [Acanthaster planci]|uniref:Uncharacterized protein LOC110975551 isoform X1 n=1 Tax=Acanthaster planci TaxID=133434 RepID=A0A8B7XUW9_ACAPL|nr:uncharacterized protein LOC110975551 isoform X1 [Acanthaster planci]
MKATCILCAVVLVLLVDFLSQTCADDSTEEASPAWLAGNRKFHGLDQFQKRWGGRHIRPQGRVPRAYDPDDEDQIEVFRRWAGRRIPYRGAINGQFKRNVDNDQEAMEDVYQYLRN